MEAQHETRIKGGLLHQIFTAHLMEGAQWPEAMEVDYPSHDRSPYWMERANERARRGRVQLREWHGTARLVADENGVERLVSFAPPVFAPLNRRLSVVAAKADEFADPKTLMGERKRARLLRPVLFAVATLAAKVERGERIAARRKRAKAA